MKRPWMVSMHGGHSGDFCDHAVGSLREMLNAAIEAGYHTFGVSEHAPRNDARFMYPNELTLGWSLEKTIADFERYVDTLPSIVAEYDGLLDVVPGFEIEVVPDATYIEFMKGYFARVTRAPVPDRVFDFFVGSVHFVDEVQIDAEPEEWTRASNAAGGPESLAVAYYGAVARMVEALRPAIVGHLDLIKRNAALAGIDPAVLISPRTIAAAESTLEAIRANNGILDLNTAGWRKGLGEPYPAPWLISRANAMGIPFCFGDDSHRPDQVGEGVERARNYLLENDVRTVTAVTKGGERRSFRLAE